MNGRVVAGAALNRRLIDAVINKAIDALNTGKTEIDLLEFLRDEDWHPQLVRVADALATLKERRDRLGLSISDLLCLDEQPWVLCAFCQEGYVRRDDPDWAKKAGEHVATCVKHPLHTALTASGAKDEQFAKFKEACELAVHHLRMQNETVGQKRTLDVLEAALAGGGSCQ